MQYVRVYSDAHGGSHFEDVDVSLTLTEFAPPAAPLYISPFVPASRLSFLSAPIDWFGDWHPAPRPQFFCILQGECEFTVTEGLSRRFSAGSVLLLEDTTGTGHAARVLGENALLVVVVQMAE